MLRPDFIGGSRLSPTQKDGYAVLIQALKSCRSQQSKQVVF